MATTGRITRASAVEALEGDMRCAAAIVQKIAQKVPFFFFLHVPVRPAGRSRPLANISPSVPPRRCFAPVTWVTLSACSAC
jgi:hypothetical protein